MSSASASSSCLVAFGAAVWLVAASGAEEEVSPRAKYFVAGSVVDEETRQPIADATLCFLVDGENDPRKRLVYASTDKQGRFHREVPLGSVRLWFPELKAGYWLEPKNAMVALSTSAEKPVATLDIAAKRGLAWPVRITVEGGLSENAQPMVSVLEVEDDATRRKVINGESVSLQAPNQAIARLDKSGVGAFTQCGKSGRLVVRVGVDDPNPAEVEGVSAELIVDRAFQIDKVKTVSQVAGSDQVELMDENGAKATVTKAEVTLRDGQPLLNFHLRRKKIDLQEFTGIVVDEAGNPIHGVHVGTALGSSGGSGEQPGSADTDQEGRFRLQVPLVESAEELQLIVNFSKSGYARFDSQNIPFPKQRVPAIDVGKFTLEPGHSCPIRVVDEQRRPLAGAVVEPGSGYAMRRAAIRTDEQGRGALRDLPAGLVRLQLSHGDRNDTAHVVISKVDAENQEVELKLEPPSAAPPVAAEATKPIAIGDVAPELVTSEWTDGKRRNLADFRGRVVVLDFWGIWCGPCVRGIPAMRELAEKFEPRDVVFLAIHTPDGDPEQINKLKRIKDWKTPIAIDRGTKTSDGTTGELYGVRAFPTVIVIDRQGKVAFTTDQPEKLGEMINEMRQIALSLEIPWPLPDDNEEEAFSIMNRLQAALFGREIEKDLAADTK